MHDENPFAFVTQFVHVRQDMTAQVTAVESTGRCVVAVEPHWVFGMHAAPTAFDWRTNPGAH